MKRSTTWILAAVVLVTVASSVYTVDETESAVVLRFGQPVRTVEEAGLYFRAPWWIDRVDAVDQRLMVFDTPTADEPTREVLTLDKKNVEIAATTCWRVVDPLRFLQTVGGRVGAEAFLADVVVSELGKVLGRTPLSALINTDPDSVRVEEIDALIRATSDTKAREECGVEVVDFAIKRITFPEQNRGSVFERMRAERKQIATRIRSEGEEEARKLRAEADRERAEILAEARRLALELEGEAEAEAARVYGDAYGRDPELYQFLRTLESYEKTLGEGTTVILPRDMPYLETLIDPDLPALRPPRAEPEPDPEGTRR
ncbi:MAG TPA: protease modulator HflC [Candidatus Krumholzibacteria bacterium]|nr:protease modulator HflC [Candidatus Krumholzibacteria bacterium]